MPAETALDWDMKRVSNALMRVFRAWFSLVRCLVLFLRRKIYLVASESIVAWGQLVRKDRRFHTPIDRYFVKLM